MAQQIPCVCVCDFPQFLHHMIYKSEWLGTDIRLNKSKCIITWWWRYYDQFLSLRRDLKLLPWKHHMVKDRNFSYQSGCLKTTYGSGSTVLLSILSYIWMVKVDLLIYFRVNVLKRLLKLLYQKFFGEDF